MVEREGEAEMFHWQFPIRQEETQGQELHPGTPCGWIIPPLLSLGPVGGSWIQNGVGRAQSSIHMSHSAAANDFIL